MRPSSPSQVSRVSPPCPTASCGSSLPAGATLIGRANVAPPGARMLASTRPDCVVKPRSPPADPLRRPSRSPSPTPQPRSGGAPRPVQRRGRAASSTRRVRPLATTPKPRGNLGLGPTTTRGRRRPLRRSPERAASLSQGGPCRSASTLPPHVPSLCSPYCSPPCRRTVPTSSGLVQRRLRATEHARRYLTRRRRSRGQYTTSTLAFRCSPRTGPN